MKNQINYHVGFLSGILLYLSGYLCSELPYFSLSNEAFIILFIISLFIGTGTIVGMVFHKPTSVYDALLRLLFAGFSYCSLYIMNGYIGTTQLVHRLFGVITHSSEDNVSGMLLLTFLSAIIAVSIFSVLILLICTVVRKK